MKAALAVLAAIPLAPATQAAPEQNVRVNTLGAPVRDANGAPINYKPADFARMQEAQPSVVASKSETTEAQGFVPNTANPIRPCNFMASPMLAAKQTASYRSYRPCRRMGMRSNAAATPESRSSSC